MDLLADVMATATGVSRLRPVRIVPGWRVPVLIALVAAVSGLIGNVGWLALNWVRGWGVLVALVLVSAQTLLALVFEALVLWVRARLLVHPDPTPAAVVRLMLLSQAPLWWSFVAIAPFFGPLLNRVLWAWSLVALWVLMIAAMPRHSLWAVLGVVVAGWLAARLVAEFLERPTRWVQERVWHRFMGRTLRRSTAELLDAVSPAALARAHRPGQVDRGRVR